MFLTMKDSSAMIDLALEGALYEQQKDYLRVHRKRYIFTLQELCSLMPAKAFLEVGSTGLFLKLVSQLYSEVSVAGTSHSEIVAVEKRGVPFSWGGEFDFFTGNPEVNSFCIPPGTFDLVLCAEVIEHMATDPMALLVELNRIMSIGGRIVVTTPNIASSRSLLNILNHDMPYNFYAFNRSGSSDRHNIEYTPGLLSKIVGAAGFEVRSLRTENCWTAPSRLVKLMYRLGGFRQDLRGDDIFLTAVKVSEVRDRYPNFIYI